MKNDVILLSDQSFTLLSLYFMAVIDFWDDKPLMATASISPPPSSKLPLLPVFEELPTSPLPPPNIVAAFDVGSRKFPGAVVAMLPYKPGQTNPAAFPMARGRIRVLSARLWDLYKKATPIEFDRPSVDARATSKIDTRYKYQRKRLTPEEKRHVMLQLATELCRWSAIDTWGLIPVHVEPQMDQIERRDPLMYAIAYAIMSSIQAHDVANGNGFPFRYMDLRAKKAALARPRTSKKRAREEEEEDDEVNVDDDTPQPSRKKPQRKRKTKADKKKESIPVDYDDRKEKNIENVRERLRLDEDWDGLQLIADLQRINLDRSKEQGLGIRDVCDAIGIAIERLDRAWDK